MSATTFCPGCGASNPEAQQGRVIYGARGRDLPPIYACGPECYRTATVRASLKRVCPECRNQFDLDAITDDYYCSRGCAKAALQRRRRVFKAARSGVVPSRLDAIRSSIGEVDLTADDITAGRLNAPGVARVALRSYRQTLDLARITAERELAQAQSESAARATRAADARAQRAPSETYDAFVKSLGDAE